MYDIHVGEQKSLVFPIMCNAYVSIGYADNIPDSEGTISDTTDDIPYGLWAHEGDFSFEAIVTPYDINGESVVRDRTNSQPEKVMPNGVTSGTDQSNYYLSITGNGRLNQEMMLFYNSKFSISLMNTTTTTINQPAEYKIRVSFYDTVTVNVDSSTVITADKERIERLNNTNYNLYKDGFNEDGFRVFDHICEVGTTANSGQRNIGINHTNNAGGYAYMPIGTELFTRNEFTYTSIGTISGIASEINLIQMTNNLTSTLNSGTALYVETYKEPKYLENTHHIGVSYSENAKLVEIYYNNRLVGSGTRSASSPAFVFDRSDFLLGRATTNTSNASNYAYTAKQFMGEMHEISIEKIYKNKYSSIHTLLPKYNETLLYLRFEEVDL